MLLLSPLYKFTKFYYSHAKNITAKAGEYSINQIKQAEVANILLGLGILCALSIITPIVFTLPVLTGIILCPFVLPIVLLSIVTTSLHKLYSVTIPRMLDGFFAYPTVRNFITAPVKALREKKLIGHKWDAFIEKPQMWIISLVHNIFLCSLIMLPEYYGLAQMFNPTATDWVLHILCFDIPIGMAMQFSPSHPFQKKLEHHKDTAAALGAVNGCILGITQGLIGYGLFNSAIGLGAYGSAIGCIINIGIAKILQVLLEKTVAGAEKIASYI